VMSVILPFCFARSPSLLYGKNGFPLIAHATRSTINEKSRAGEYQMSSGFNPLLRNSCLRWRAKVHKLEAATATIWLCFRQKNTGLDWSHRVAFRRLKRVSDMFQYSIVNLSSEFYAS
jgi:hypothetical protein